jgi:hypothetical protein
MKTFEPLCVFECDDCGKFLVVLSEQLSLFLVDEEIYGLSRCPYCDRVMKNKCTLDVAQSLLELEVKIFSWNDGEEYEF